MPGYAKDKQKIATGLRRIEGQERGVQKMVDIMHRLDALGGDADA